MVVSLTDSTSSPPAADLLSALRPAAPKSDLQSSFDDHLKQVNARSADSKPRSSQASDGESTSSAAPPPASSATTNKPAAATKESSKPADAEADETPEGLQHEEARTDDHAADSAADPAKLAVIAVQASQAKTVLTNKKAAVTQAGAAKAEKVTDGKAKQNGTKNAPAANAKAAASNPPPQSGLQAATGAQAKTDVTATDPTVSATANADKAVAAAPSAGEVTATVPAEKQPPTSEAKVETAAGPRGDVQQIVQQVVNASQAPVGKESKPAATPTATPTEPATHPVQPVEGKDKGETKKDAQAASHDVLQPMAAQMAVATPPPAAAAPSVAITPKSDTSVQSVSEAASATSAGNPHAVDPTPDSAPIAGPAAVADATAKPNNESGPTTQPMSQSGASSGISDVERARLVQRVSRAMQTASEGEGTLRLRLSPPELGAVRMEVSIKDGVMSARFETETSAAKSALVESLPDLQSRLAEHDIKLEHFEVDLADRGGLGTPNPSGQQAGQQREAASGGPRFKPNQSLAAAEPAAATAATATRIVTNDQLNVVV